ncbi:MAG: ShlB/FhaC/HecB family hemolysin secretion/activation protein [Burkholderiaceae bacterium]
MRVTGIFLQVVGLSVCCELAFAQQPPTSGSQLQQIPAAPALQKPAPEIRIQPEAAPAAPESDQVKIVVKSLRVTGQTVYSEDALIAVMGFTPGSEMTLGELRAMASKLSDFYHRNGYFVAQAYLPAQDINNGAVTIAVLEGRYGRVTLRNQTNLSDRLANLVLGDLGDGNAIAIAPLETRLLLLSDIPGVNVQSTLVPGTAVGTSDLLVDITPGPRVSGSVDADNAGNRYTGYYRLGATVYLNDLTGYGDLLSLRALTSTDGLNYGRAAWQAQVDRARFGVAYSALDYRLGREFASLEANGTAKVASVYGSYALIRSRSTNLSAQLAYDHRRFEDKVDSTASVTDKRANVWTASIGGDHRDALFGGGASSYSAAWTHGNLEIPSAGARAADATTVRTAGQYDKLGVNAMRLQGVTETFSMYAAVTAQYASKNLDISEKIGLGGVDAVRAYPSGEAYGDNGYVLNIEARQTLPRYFDWLPGQMQAIAFLDNGMVRLNRDAYAPGVNHRTLSGAGLGINWIDVNDFVVRGYWAHKLGDAASSSAPDRKNRFWLQVSKFF